jgi:Flp pilus assembly protein TadG
MLKSSQVSEVLAAAPLSWCNEPAGRRMMFGGAARIPRILTAGENAGAAAVEFALFLPFFVLIIAGTFDLWYLIYSASQLTSAVSAGALYAANNATLASTSAANLQSNIQSIVGNANGASWATSMVDVNNGDVTHCYCPTGSPGSWIWGSAITCGAACSGGAVAGQFVTITATRTLSPLIPTFGLTENSTISRSAMVETQ